MRSTTRFSRDSWMVWMVVAVAAWPAGGTAVAQGAAIFVKADASGANNGTSWADAFKQVQPALDAAAGGDEVWVAAGTYVENITLKDAVALYGGFAGNETELAQRNWVTNKTILDGNQAGSVVTCPAGATATTRIDGFTIRNGKASRGGGIHCYSSSPSITNNTITNNNAWNYGGGLACYETSAMIANNTITNNTSGYYGGGIYCFLSSPTIANNVIAANSAGEYYEAYGGGIYCTDSSPAIMSNTIILNAATTRSHWAYGGGICCSGGSPTIANNKIAGNTAVALEHYYYEGAYGGGIVCSGSPTIAGNAITGNGAGDAGGGICCYTTSSLIVNNTIAGNSAPTAGAIYCGSSSPTIANTIVAFNSSGISGSGAPTLRHNCVYGNGAYNYSGIADPAGTDGNISADPRLAGRAYGNVHIQPDSPCRDAGDDAAVQSGWLDIDGQARIQGGHVDIGADESDGTVWPAEPNVIVRVSLEGDDANDGSAWSLAKKTVQAGINLAASLGGEVWVQAGTYCERITLHPLAHVYGGFSGTESMRDSRDWTANVTILDGQQGGSVVTVAAGYQVNTIDGLTIRNGNAAYGGGIHSGSASPAIANCAISGNAAEYGGGIYCSSSTTIANSTISGNSAFHNGGGICGSPTMVNSTLAGNIATNGGGVYCSSPTTITNTIIAFNSSGISMTGSGTPTLRHNCVYGNKAYNYSGIADLTGTDGNISADPRLAGLAYGNMHIQPDSPCRDAGDDAAVQSGWLDIDGQARMQGSRVDIGADESDGTVWPAGSYVIVRVSLEGDDANDGSSWSLAKKTVQAGIEAAALLGGEVWVMAGTYPERISLRPFTHLYGGFGMAEETRDQRDFRSNVTILDGQQGGSVVTAQGVGDGVSTIDGFTIRNGKASRGGGVFCIASSLRIANNIITANSAFDDYHHAYGGGICCTYCSPEIVNNTITANSALSYRYSAHGGGISCDHSSPMIARNTITANEAHASTYDSACGGAIFSSDGSPMITDNVIRANFAVTGHIDAYGGGIYCSGGSPAIANNRITGNGADDAGGGVFCGSSFATIANNTITGNSASNRGGGGIHCVGGSPAITNNTIAANSAPWHGGGIYCQDSSPTIANTIIASNSSGICNDGSGTPTLRYGCVYNNETYNYSGVADPTGINGNISADPKLAGVGYGNMHIQPDSPCREAGDDTAIQPGWLDIDGQARAQGARVDIGADESDGTVWVVPSAIVRVSSEGNDTNDGSSWSLAKRTVQAGIDVASLLGGEVWVKAGTYPERISLRVFAQVYGGFSGSEDTRDDRNCRANATILDGQQGGSVVTTKWGGYGSNAIDGFTIRNGNASNGGGIHCSSSSTAIANNTICGNTASVGGGIYCYASFPIITNNTIAGNTASSGGGMSCVVSSPVVANNTITGNVASTGGGICLNGTHPAIANTIVAFNSSGIIRMRGSVMLRYNCVFGNTAYDYSGLTDPTGTDGNISADPLFVRPAGPGPDGQWGTADDDYGDLRLSNGSPCIDAGDNAAVPADTLDLDGDGDTTEPLPFDLLGGLRFFDDPFTIDTGLGTPPIVDMGAYEHVPMPAALESSIPANGRSLWRNQRNIIRLTFNWDIDSPPAGVVMIQEMLAGGTYGDDLSAGFTFTVENDGQGQPRVLKIRETGSSLAHRKWYAVRNTGAWTSVAPFTVQYVVQVGDANNDGRVLNTDFGWVNAAIPTFSTADDDRRDINGDRRILNTDFGVLNSKIPSFPVAKPAGH